MFVDLKQAGQSFSDKIVLFSLIIGFERYILICNFDIIEFDSWPETACQSLLDARVTLQIIWFENFV